jgi:hypothetical protein
MTGKRHKCMLLSDRSLSENTYCRIPTIWHSGKSKIMERVKNIRGFQELDRRGMHSQSTEFLGEKNYNV